MRRVLLLNGSREPLNFISEEDAIYLMCKGRVEVVCSWADEIIRSAHTSWPAPAIVALKRYIRKQWRAPRFRRRALFNRDGWTCQYCGAAVLPKSAGASQGAEVEHILPASRGGKTTWNNCVTACRSCNKKKRNRTPEEAEMHLLTVPKEPHPLHFMDQASRSMWHPSWNDYLPSFARSQDR